MESFSRASWMAPLIALFACGTSVATGTGGNAHGTGGEGAGGSSGNVSGGGANGQNGVTSASGMVATTGGGQGGAALCAAACDHVAMLGCQEDGCFEQCVATYDSAPRCAPQLDELAKCLTGVTVCDYQIECGGPLDAFTGCLEGGCGLVDCAEGGTSGGQTMCICTAVCNGQEVTADCTSFDGVEAKCQCSVNGMFVAGCIEEASLGCDLGVGCCSRYF